MIIIQIDEDKTRKLILSGNTEVIGVFDAEHSEELRNHSAILTIDNMAENIIGYIREVKTKGAFNFISEYYTYKKITNDKYYKYEFSYNIFSEISSIIDSIEELQKNQKDLKSSTQAVPYLINLNQTLLKQLIAEKFVSTEIFKDNKKIGMADIFIDNNVINVLARYFDSGEYLQTDKIFFNFDDNIIKKISANLKILKNLKC